MQTLLTVGMLSTRLHKTLATIRSAASRNPTSLPPICRLPGTKRLLWRECDVDDWLAQYVTPAVAKKVPDVTTREPGETPAQAPDKRRPGRPTKAEQIARLKLAAREFGSGEATVQHN